MSVQDGLDPVAAIAALEARLAATSRATRPHEHAAAAYRLGLARAESPVGDPADNLRQALDSYALAASIFDARHDPMEHARVLNAAGAAHRGLGRRRRAADLFTQAAALFEAEGGDQERAAALNNLGLTRAELGERDAAIAAFDEAADLFDVGTADGRRGRASTLHNRGQAQAAGGTAADLRAAIADQEEAKAAVEQDEAPYHHALADHSLGVAASGLADVDPEGRAGHLRTAIDAFGSSLATFTRAAFPYQHTLALHNLGRALAATGDLLDLRRALAYFEDAVAVLDPRLHAEPWRHAHASLERAEAELARRQGSPASRPLNFVILAASMASSERIPLLRGRFKRLLGLPGPARDAAFAELALASTTLEQAVATGYITDEIIVLMEFPNEGLEAALSARMMAHRLLDGDIRLAADRALDAAVGDALGLSQRLLVREHLSSLGFERP